MNLDEISRAPDTFPGLTHPTGVISTVESMTLIAAPIEPDWIMTGKPQARSSMHSASRDGGSSTHVWDCTAGKFKWKFGWAETVMILEGTVNVTSPDGKTTQLKPNSVAYFAAGTEWVWEVEKYVRKLAFLHRPASRLDVAYRAIRAGAAGLKLSLTSTVCVAIAAAASAAAILSVE